MKESFRLFPVPASTHARDVDLLFIGLIVTCGTFVFLIAGLIVYFAVKYRKRSPQQVGQGRTENLWLEGIWTIVPLILGLALFGWGVALYLRIYSAPPKNANEIFVVAKQWMWKFQHADGRKEINELHIPVGVPMKLLMISQDVIHSFFVPSFRIKLDVLPMRYTQMWFEASIPGQYHLFCAEYCGTKHSAMVGRIVAMEPARYEEWLGGTKGEGSPVAEGRALLERLGCRGCHREDSLQTAPRLEALFGGRVNLQGGGFLVADENYLRESVLTPRKKLVSGYQAIMPSYEGRISEEELLQILTYLKETGQKENE